MASSSVDPQRRGLLKIRLTGEFFRTRLLELSDYF